MTDTVLLTLKHLRFGNLLIWNHNKLSLTAGVLRMEDERRATTHSRVRLLRGILLLLKVDRSAGDTIFWFYHEGLLSWQAVLLSGCFVDYSADTWFLKIKSDCFIKDNDFALLAILEDLLLYGGPR